MRDLLTKILNVLYVYNNNDIRIRFVSFDAGYKSHICGALPTIIYIIQLQKERNLFAMIMRCMKMKLKKFFIKKREKTIVNAGKTNKKNLL